MKAAEKGHTAIVNLLLLQGAVVNATNTVSKTFLFLARFSFYSLTVLRVKKMHFYRPERQLFTWQQK